MAEPTELKENTPTINVRDLDDADFIVPPGWYGLVPAAGIGIIHADGCDMNTGLIVLERLASPDPDSRSQEHDGRRMVRINGGYLILNYFKYRDRDYTAAERMKRLRQRKKDNPVTRNTVDVTANVTQAEDREQSTEYREQINNTSSSTPIVVSEEFEPDFLELITRIREAGGSLEAWKAELRVAREGLHGPIATPAQIGQAIRDFNANGAKPVLRLFRAFLRSTVVGPYDKRAQGKPTNDRTTRNIAAIADWYVSQPVESDNGNQ